MLFFVPMAKDCSQLFFAPLYYVLWPNAIIMLLDVVSHPGDLLFEHCCPSLRMYLNYVSAAVDRRSSCMMVGHAERVAAGLKLFLDGFDLIDSS
jgi:hypothetical protein